jgi:hypothetical protein
MTDGDSALHGGTRAAVNDSSRRVVGSREREREKLTRDLSVGRGREATISERGPGRVRKSG